MPVNGPASRRAINGKTVAGAQRKPRHRAGRRQNSLLARFSSHGLARIVNRRNACRTTDAKTSRSWEL